METGSVESPQRPCRRWQFSLATLFILMTVACVILSRFYPRAYASVQIQIPAMTAQKVPTYMEIIRSHRIVSGVATRCPQLTGLAGVGTVSWVRAHVEVRHVEKDILEIGMSGRPGDRDRMHRLIDAIAEEYVNFLTSTTGQVSDEAMATLQRRYDEVNAQLMLTDEIEAPTSNGELLGGGVGSQQAELRAKQARLLELLAKRIEELKATQKQFPPRPKVIRRDSGLGW